MDVSKALATIYEVCVKSVGKEKASSAFSANLSGIVRDLNEKGIPITSEAIEQAIIEEGQFFKKCMEKDAA